MCRVQLSRPAAATNSIQWSQETLGIDKGEMGQQFGSNKEAERLQGELDACNAKFRAAEEQRVAGDVQRAVLETQLQASKASLSDLKPAQDALTVCHNRIAERDANNTTQNASLQTCLARATLMERDQPRSAAFILGASLAVSMLSLSDSGYSQWILVTETHRQRWTAPFTVPPPAEGLPITLRDYQWVDVTGEADMEDSLTLAIKIRTGAGLWSRVPLR